MIQEKVERGSKGQKEREEAQEPSQVVEDRISTPPSEFIYTHKQFFCFLRDKQRIGYLCLTLSTLLPLYLHRHFLKIVQTYQWIQVET